MMLLQYNQGLHPEICFLLSFFQDYKKKILPQLAFWKI